MRAKILSILIAIISSFALHAQDASMYLKYANRGDKDAMYNLAGCYWSGNGGVAQDYQSAFNWYEKAAKKNHQPAQHMTALCYLYGIGTVQDWRKAWDYADKAIKKGFGPSYWIKAQVYKEGYMSNITNGYLTNLTNAANSGYAKAMSDYKLGNIPSYELNVYKTKYNTARLQSVQSEITLKYKTDLLKVIFE